MWNHHPKEKKKWLCGKCYMKLKNPPKYSNEERKQIRRKRFTENNPSKTKKGRERIRNRQWGKNNSFSEHTHSEEAKQKQRESMLGTKNPNFNKKRSGTESAEKQSLTMKKKYARGEIKLNPVKGKNHPLYGKKRNEEIRKKISESLTGKPKSDKHKRKLAESSSKQKFKKKDNENEKRCVALLEEMKLPYLTQDHFDVELLRKFSWARTKPDFFVPPSLVIFADGDYSHANPNPHKNPYKNGRLEKGIPNDKILRGGNTAKEKRIKDQEIDQRLKSQKLTSVRLWDSDIAYNKKKCMKKINEYFKQLHKSSKKKSKGLKLK